MKIAIAGKGGVGKTTVTAWLADFLARSGKTVWMVDADTALSLGQASGMDKTCLPKALIHQQELINTYIRPSNGTMLNLTPNVSHLPQALSVVAPLLGAVLEGCVAGEKRLLIMGALSHANGGCACESNALLKALLAHLILTNDDWVLVDLEAGVEHLGRGTVAHVDQLFIVAEPSYRSLEVAAEVGRMACDLGVKQQHLILNRATPEALTQLPALEGLPSSVFMLPAIEALQKQQLASGSVFGLGEETHTMIDAFLFSLLQQIVPENDVLQRITM